MNKEIENLVNILNKHRENYYINGNSDLTDDEFDELENKLRELDPDNDYFNNIGYSSSRILEEDQVYHKVPMLSMKKQKTPDGAIKWAVGLYLQTEPEYVSRLDSVRWKIQPKIDGLSCTIHYDKNGIFQYMATRGDGHIGSIIKYGKEILDNNNIPYILYKGESEDYDILYDKEIELRGELYIERTEENKDTPLRNIAVGVIQRKELTTDIQKIRVCLYSVVDVTNKNFISYGTWFPDSIPKNKTISQFSLTCTKNEIESTYKKYIDTVRDKFPFETDGLVIYYPNEKYYEIIDKNVSVDKTVHHYNLALKPPSKGNITTVVGVKYNVSMNNLLIPVCMLKPVKINNRTISNVTLSNWEYLVSKNIKIGSGVSIIIAGDIIPKIDNVIDLGNETYPIHPPKHCPECNSEVIIEGKNLICTNIFCIGSITSRIDFLCQKVKIKGLSVATIHKILETFDCYNITKFFKTILNNNKVKDIIGPKNTDNIRQSIENVLFRLTDIELLAFASNIPSLGLKQIEKELPFNNIYDFFEKVRKNPNSALKRNIINWCNNQIKYNEFIEFYEFIKSKK